MPEINQSGQRPPRRGFGSHGFFSMHFAGAITDVEMHLRYLDTMLHHIEGIRDEYDAHLRAKIESAGDLSAEDVDYYYEAHREEWESIKYGFPAILLDNLYVSFMTLWETRIIEICKELDSDNQIGTPSRWSEFKRENPFKRSAKYLNENFQIVLENWERWAVVDDYVWIRNCFVHTEGQPQTMQPAHRSKVELAVGRQTQFGLAAPDPERGRFRICLSREFIRKQADDIVDFFESLQRAFWNHRTIGPMYWP